MATASSVSQYVRAHCTQWACNCGCRSTSSSRTAMGSGWWKTCPRGQVARYPSGVRSTCEIVESLMRGRDRSTLTRGPLRRRSRGGTTLRRSPTRRRGVGRCGDYPSPALSNGDEPVPSRGAGDLRMVKCGESLLTLCRRKKKIRPVFFIFSRRAPERLITFHHFPSGAGR